jgi:hypothetical protein
LKKGYKCGPRLLPKEDTNPRRRRPQRPARPGDEEILVVADKLREEGKSTPEILDVMNRRPVSLDTNPSNILYRNGLSNFEPTRR